MSAVSTAERRKEGRTESDDSVYVVVNTNPQMMGQMVEISSTGMAFTFVDLNAVSKLLGDRDDLELDLFAGGKGYFLRDLSCRLVSKIDNAINSPFSSLLIKRIGVEFVEPSISQQIQINALIRRQHQQSTRLSAVHGDA